MAQQCSICARPKRFEIEKALLERESLKADTERAVLIFHKADGSLVAEAKGYTNQFCSLSSKWNPATIAIVHTHRSYDDAE